MDGSETGVHIKSAHYPHISLVVLEGEASLISASFTDDTGSDILQNFGLWL